MLRWVRLGQAWHLSFTTGATLCGFVDVMFDEFMHLGAIHPAPRCMDCLTRIKKELGL